MKWVVMIVILCMYVAVCHAREGFVSTGIQVNTRMNVKDILRKLDSLPVKHLIIIPFIGTNKLNLLIKQINALETSFDNIYIMVVDIENEANTVFANQFFSTICPTTLDFKNQPVVVLTRTDTPSQLYSYNESTDTVFLYRINQVLIKINNE
jgi:hypothetical protein